MATRLALIFHISWDASLPPPLTVRRERVCHSRSLNDCLACSMQCFQTHRQESHCGEAIERSTLTARHAIFPTTPNWTNTSADPAASKTEQGSPCAASSLCLMRQPVCFCRSSHLDFGRVNSAT